MKRIQKVLILSLFLLPMFSSCDIVSINQTSSNGNTSIDDSTSEVASSVQGETTSSEEISSNEVTSNEESSSEISEVSTSDENTDDYPNRIAIYSINDTHGAIEEDASSSTYIPGMANLNYCIKNDADFSDDYSVLLSAGDMSQGTGISNITEGQCMMECMNSMGIDAMALGNHEFDWGVDTIAEEEETANFPFLGINILNKSDGNIIDLAQPSTIITKGSVKIGVVGSIYRFIRNSISASQIEDIEFVDDEPLVTAEAARLKEEENCDIVVVLTHQAGSTDAVNEYLTDSNIDGIFGGHNHAFSCIQSSDQKRYFLEAGCNSRAYSKLVLTKDSSGDYSVESGETDRIYESNCTNASSPEIESIVNSYLAIFQEVLEEVVAERDESFGKDQLGTLVTEAMMYYAEEVCKVDDIAVAVHNKGGIRSTWTSSELNDDGLYDITYGDIYEVMPFDNEVQYIELSGETLIDACTDSYNYHSKDFTKENSKYYLNGVEVDDDATYKVLAIDYIITNSSSACYQGGKNGTPINGEVVFTRDLIKDYISHLGIVKVADFPSL
ncbi:MAG: bifunctional UDP-sugar hydrolase/5'-nucleotidase [Bacilli bacterium]